MVRCSPGDCVVPFVTPVLKATIDFPSEKKCHIINLFVYSTSEPTGRGKKEALCHFSEWYPLLFSKPNFLGHHNVAEMDLRS